MCFTDIFCLKVDVLIKTQLRCQIAHFDHRLTRAAKNGEPGQRSNGDQVDQIDPALHSQAREGQGKFMTIIMAEKNLSYHWNIYCINGLPSLGIDLVSHCPCRESPRYWIVWSCVIISIEFMNGTFNVLIRFQLKVAFTTVGPWEVDAYWNNRLL